MATVYRPTRTDPATGRPCHYAKWYIRYRGADGRLHNVAGYCDKAATQARATELERRADREAAGIADPAETELRRPLAEHLADFGRSLEAKGDVAAHVALTLKRIRSVVAGCGFSRIADLSGARVADWLKARRDAGLSVASSNGYLRSMKSLCRFLVRDRRTASDPLAHLSTGNERTDRRRVLTQEEFGRLYEAARHGAPFRGLTGPDRATLYLTAVHTGLRRNELATLTAGALALDANPPTLTVRATYSRHRRDDVVDLRPDLATELRRLAAGKLPAARLWPGTWHGRSARMLRLHLDAAGIPYRDDAGRVVDFHALRHTGITWFSKVAHPKATQTFARHHSAAFTLDRYAHVARLDMAAGLAALPGIPTAAALAATGTAGVQLTTSYALPCALPGAFPGNPVTTGETPGGGGAAQAGARNPNAGDVLTTGETTGDLVRSGVSDGT